MRQLLTMTLTDLRQRVRDRSVVIFAVVVPLALMSVFSWVFGSADDLELEPVTVAVSTPADDELAATVPAVLRGLDSADLPVTVVETDAAAARAQVEADEAAAAVLVPEGFGAALITGSEVTVQAVEGDSAGLESSIVLTVVDGLLDQLAAGSQTARAAIAEGVSPAEVAQVARDATAAASGPSFELAQGQAADEQLDADGALVAGQAGLFLLFTVSFGVLGLVAERELGTLARLRSMPMAPWLIVAAKALSSFVLGVVATAVLLTAGSVLFGVDFGSPLAVAVLIVCVSAAGTSIMFLIARVARTSEQASIAQSIIAIVLGIAGGAFFPVSGSGLLATVLDLNPVAAFIRGLGITSGGGGVADIVVPVTVLLGFGVVMLAVARLVPDRGAAL